MTEDSIAGNWEAMAKVTTLKGTELTGVYKYHLVTVGLLTSQSHPAAPDQLPPLRGANSVGAHAGIQGDGVTVAAVGQAQFLLRAE